MPTQQAISTPPTPVPPPQQRRKGAGIRAWLVISASGNSHLEEVGKHLIMRRTGLPARDLRVLDPGLSYPSTILGRDRAIVVNLEHIKAIITATQIWVLNSKDPSVVPFVHDLECRVSNLNETRNATMEESPGVLDSRHSSQRFGRSTSGSPEAEMLETNGSGSLVYTGDMQVEGAVKVLPFELRVLEVCFESVCRSLEAETSTLEQEAYPALDELTSKTSTHNLQRARHIKSRLVALFGRVQKVRDEFENLLDDDMDMAEMYLTDKLFDLQVEEDASKKELEKDIDTFDLDNESGEDSQNNKSSSGRVTGFKPNVEELEMLLEAYFAQIGGTLNKLSALREYVDDTEDYINIMLDDKQNQLLQMGVLLSTATLLLNASIAVVALFGMNIKISLFKTGPAEFWETAIGTVVGSLALYFIAFYMGKKKGLLE
ncbi:magnesium transporter MRS2-F-like isoform X1 [Macadamia integrifolia]|uniref:magnesium transporter MRS2-F-like isoform X1 n=1 Tax=Macadamia integrifolia TaxID=60698 RepID=UPI001C4F6681|nr:magnesium transporter MRS2-F-like isoform X1 [Macadamia integrifolia]